MIAPMVVTVRGCVLLGMLLLVGACEAASSEPPQRVVMGLPVVRVTEAQSLRDQASEDDPIAVSGWYSTGPPHSCPAPMDGPRSPLAMDCDRGQSVIAELPEAPIVVQRTVNGDMTSITVRPRDMEGPYLEPFRDSPVNGDPFGGADPWIPVPVVAIGHFNDHRAAGCIAADREFCAGVFVVDHIAEAHGDELGVVLEGDPGLGPAKRSVDETVQLIESEFGDDAQLVSLQALRGQDLVNYEDRAPEIPDLAVVWLAEVVDLGSDGTGEPELVTLLVADDTATVLWTSRD